MTPVPVSAELAAVPERLWSRVASAPHRVLFLDYDGTLAPFHVRRDEARASSAVLRLVREIASAEGTTVTIASGRPVAELLDLVGPLPVILIGEHGWEILRPGAGLERHPIPAESLASLETAAEAADREGWGAHVERKRGALALHTRGQPREQEARLLQAAGRAWGELAGRNGMRLDAIHGGLELRAAGRDKGAAVREIAAACPPGTLVVCLGDDLTDEDAFREALRDGFGILVGTDAGTSLATGRLPSIQAVGAFLERWSAVARRRRES